MAASNSAKAAGHTVYLNPRQNKVSAVPRHTEINEILARKICRDLEIPNP